MQPNYASAVILNNAVKAYNILESKQDISVSMEEFAANFDSVQKDIYLLYGLKNISPNNSEFVNSILVFGKGLVKSNLLNNIVELPSTTTNQTGYRLTEILGNNTDISNCYVFAALYAICDGANISLEISLGKSALDKNGDVFIISNDIDLDSAKDIAYYSTDIVYPTNAQQSVLLYKFIINVETYDGIDKNSRAFITIIDERKPRSFYSISDDKASSVMTPAMFKFADYYEYMRDIQYNSLTQVINDWINLDSWSPSFAHYWYAANPSLPAELKDFILYEIGYDLSWHITPGSLGSKQIMGAHGLVV